MKSYTDLSQSKKLAEFLPIESADMYYACGAIVPDIMISSKQDYRCYTVCWSLAALLSVIPEVSLNTFKDGKWNAMIQHDGKMIYEDKDNPVDACYEMILKLHELKML